MLRRRLEQILGPRGVASIRAARRRARRGIGTHPALQIPASSNWGFDRGSPVDRHYIEAFLQGHATDIRGRVLEVGDDTYARAYGRSSEIAQLDVVDIEETNSQATIIADLSDPDALPEASFDCIIFTEVLMLVFDFRQALANLYRALRPGGVLLITVAGITRGCRQGDEVRGDYWRFTGESLRLLLDELFEPANVRVESYGNVRSAAAFLYGLAAEELKAGELEARDPDYEVTVAGRAVKD